MKKNRSLILLIILSLVWSSFALFTKITALVLSPFVVVFFRLIIGGAFLYLICLKQKKKIHYRKNFKHYAVIGLLNSAVPFTLFAFTARHLNSGILTILEGTIPMFEVIIAILVLKKTVNNKVILGVVLGIFGVIVTAMNHDDNFTVSINYILSVLGVLLATICFAISSVYIEKTCKKTDPIVNATGSVVVATFFMSPILFFADLSAIADLKILLSLIALGILCTGISYVIYFKLIVEEGPRFAVTYSLLVPIFGVILGALFLSENITLNHIIGSILIIISIKFITNLSLAKN